MHAGKTPNTEVNWGDVCTEPYTVCTTFSVYTLYILHCTVAGLFTGAQGAVRGGEEGGEGEDSSGGQEEGDVQVGLQEWRSGL